MARIGQGMQARDVRERKSTSSNLTTYLSIWQISVEVDTAPAVSVLKVNNANVDTQVPSPCHVPRFEVAMKKQHSVVCNVVRNECSNSTIHLLEVASYLNEVLSPVSLAGEDTFDIVLTFWVSRVLSIKAIEDPQSWPAELSMELVIQMQVMVGHR